MNRITVYIFKELLRFIRKKSLNVFKLTHNVLNRIRLGLGEDFNINSADLVLVSQKGFDNSGSEEIRTPDLRRVKATSYH